MIYKENLLKVIFVTKKKCQHNIFTISVNLSDDVTLVLRLSTTQKRTHSDCRFPANDNDKLHQQRFIVSIRRTIECSI